MKIVSELFELRFIAPTQTEIGFEFIELRFITPTQMEIGFEFIELRIVTPYLNRPTIASHIWLKKLPTLSTNPLSSACCRASPNLS